MIVDLGVGMAFVAGFVCAGLLSLARWRTVVELAFVVCLTASIYVLVLWGFWMILWSVAT